MNNNSGSFLLGAVIGAMAGGVAALLLSPRSGRENRKYLVRMANKGQKYVADRYEDVVDMAEDVYDEASKQVGHMAKNVEKSVQPLRKEVSKYAVGALDTLEDNIKDTRKTFFKGVKH